mmetsp:Transcript_116762/g.371561  ORF Transcript_116762/g.371561 Transcript_116762/m.371561 type:complete len:233 (-) Transcript_116762:2847-3545(-)
MQPLLASALGVLRLMEVGEVHAFADVLGHTHDGSELSDLATMNGPRLLLLFVGLRLPTVQTGQQTCVVKVLMLERIHAGHQVRLLRPSLQPPHHVELDQRGSPNGEGAPALVQIPNLAIAIHIRLPAQSASGQLREEVAHLVPTRYPQRAVDGVLPLRGHHGRVCAEAQQVLESEKGHRVGHVLRGRQGMQPAAPARAPEDASLAVEPLELRAAPDVDTSCGDDDVLVRVEG